MPQVTVERRKTRSSDPHEALRLQLVTVCQSAGIGAAVLASEEGLPIAQVGDAALCDELAAIVPFVAEQRSMPPHTSLGAGALHVRPIRFDGHALYLAACSDAPEVDATPEQLEHFLLHAGEAVARILRAA
jgi:hypothetical protein